MRWLFGLGLLVLSLWGIGMMVTAQEPEPPGKTVITWATDDTPIRREQIRAFNELHPDLEVRLDPTNNSPNKVIIQSLGNVGPDVFDMAGTSLPIFVSAGIALDLTDHFEQTGFNVEKEIWTAAEPLYRLNGRTYGIPANLDSLALIYNRDILEQAGLPEPSSTPTWPEIIDLAQKLTVRQADGRVDRFGLLFWWDWRDFFSFEGARIFRNNGTEVAIDSPEALRALTRMSDLVYKYNVAPTPNQASAMATAGGWGGGNESRFVAGRAAMVLGPRYFTAHFRRAGNMRVGVAQIPLGPGGATRARGRAVAVNARSPRREAALKFIEFLTGPEYNRINNDMADGMGPIIRFTSEPKFLLNPDFPEEKSNPVWRESLLRARPEESSPFLPSSKVDQAVGFHLDLLSQGRKTPEQALKHIQRDAERLLRNELRENPELKAQWQQVREGRS